MSEDPLRLYARFHARLNGLNPDDYEKQLDAESSFNPSAVSPKGARGIAQFMPATGKQYGLNTPDDLHDPIKSIRSGAKYMADLKAQADGDEQAARVGYNAGPRAMQRFQHGGRIPSETSGYIKKIDGDDPESLYEKFQSQLKSAAPTRADAADGTAGRVPAVASPSISQGSRIAARSSLGLPAQTAAPKGEFDFSRFGATSEFHPEEIKRTQERKRRRIAPRSSLMDAETPHPSLPAAPTEVPETGGEITAEQSRMLGPAGTRAMIQSQDEAPQRAAQDRLDVLQKGQAHYLKSLPQEQRHGAAKAIVARGESLGDEARELAGFDPLERAITTVGAPLMSGMGRVLSGIGVEAETIAPTLGYKDYHSGLKTTGANLQEAGKNIGQIGYQGPVTRFAQGAVGLVPLAAGGLPEFVMDAYLESRGSGADHAEALKHAATTAAGLYAGGKLSHAFEKEVEGAVERYFARSAGIGAGLTGASAVAGEPQSLESLGHTAGMSLLFGLPHGAGEKPASEASRRAPAGAVEQRGAADVSTGQSPSELVPEPLEAITAQLEALRAGRGNRRAVLVPTEDQMPVGKGELTAQGLTTTKTAAGTFVHISDSKNPLALSHAAVRKMVADGSYHEALGIVEAKSPMATEAVTARNEKGTELQTAMTSPENIPAQAEELAAQHPQAKIAVESPEKVIADRVASVPFMITRDARQQLSDLGYSRTQIDGMKPETAQMILESGRRSNLAPKPATEAATIPQQSQGRYRLEDAKPAAEPAKPIAEAALSTESPLLDQRLPEFDMTLRDFAERNLPNLTKIAQESPDWRTFNRKAGEFNQANPGVRGGEGRAFGNVTEWTDDPVKTYEALRSIRTHAAKPPEAPKAEAGPAEPDLHPANYQPRDSETRQFVPGPPEYPAEDARGAETRRAAAYDKLVALRRESEDKLFQASNLSATETDRVRAKLEALKGEVTPKRPLRTVVDEYLRQGSLFGAHELNPDQQELLRDLANPARRAKDTSEQGALFEKSPTLESRRERSQTDKAGPTFGQGGLFQRASQMIGIFNPEGKLVGTASLSQDPDPAKFVREQYGRGFTHGPLTMEGEGAKRIGSGKQTGTFEFKRWFGGSKVVDEKGEPLVVYHGGTVKDVFKLEHAGDVGHHFGTKEVASRFGEPRPFYLKAENLLRVEDGGDTAGWAKTIADGLEAHENADEYQDAIDGLRGVYDGGLEEAWAEADDEVPSGKRADYEDRQIEVENLAQRKVAKMIRSWLVDTPFDAIVYSNLAEGKGEGDSYLIFRSNKLAQIKSATGNQGTFDPKNPNILFQADRSPEHKILSEVIDDFAKEGITDFKEAAEKFRDTFGPAHSYGEIFEEAWDANKNVRKRGKLTFDDALEDEPMKKRRTLTQAVIDNGRLKSTGFSGKGEKRMLSVKEGGRLGLFSDRGVNAEDMMRTLEAEGWNFDEDLGKFFDALRDEAGGRPHYSMEGASEHGSEEVERQWEEMGRKEFAEKSDHSAMAKAFDNQSDPEYAPWVEAFDDIKQSGHPEDIESFKHYSHEIGLSPEAINRLIEAADRHRTAEENRTRRAEEHGGESATIPTDAASFKQGLVDHFKYSSEAADATTSVADALINTLAKESGQSKESLYRQMWVTSGGKGEGLEQAAKSLIAIHNTTQRGILEAAKLGGIPVPSLAITRPEMKFTSHGDITLIGNREMVDPKADSRNKVFAADVYSGRQPRESHPFTPRKLDDFSDRIKATGAVKDITGFDSYYDVASQIRDVKYGAEDIKEDVFRELSHDMVVQLAFLRERGVRVEVPQQAEKNYRGSKADLGQLRDVLDTAITARQKEFDTWIEKNTAPAFGEAYLQTGRKRVPYTLANVLAAMTRPPRGREEGMTHSLGKARATSAKPLTSVEAMHKAESSLAMPEEVKAYADETQQRFFEFQNRIADRYQYPHAFQFDKLDDLSKAMGDYLKGPKGRDNFERALRRHDYNPSNIFNEVFDEGIAIAERLRNTPTQYFEAKPQRAVGLGEFAGAIVPSDASQEVLRALRNAGVTDIRTYKAGDREDQAAKAKEFQNALFQGPRGMTSFLKTGEAIIRALQNPNESTAVHEIHHALLPEFMRLAGQEGISEQFGKDMSHMARWMNLRDAAHFNELHEQYQNGTLRGRELKRYVDAQEKGARGFEKYLRTGKAPTPALEAAFSRFKEWLTDIYQNLKGSEIDIDIGPRQTAVWDRMLGGRGEQGPKITGIKSAITEAERADRGLDPIEKSLRRDFGTVLGEGKKLVDENPYFRESVIADLIHNPRAPSDAEDAALAYDRMKLYNEHRAALKELGDAVEGDDGTAIVQTGYKLKAIEEAIDLNDRAAKLSGTESGRSLNARKMMIRDDYSMATMIQKAKVAAREAGKTLSPETEQTVRDMADKIADYESKLDARERYITELESQKAREEKVQNWRAKTGRKPRSKDALDSELLRMQDHFALLARGGEPSPEKPRGLFQADQYEGPFTDEMRKLIKDMARNRVEAGARTAENVNEQVHRIVSQYLPDVEPRDVGDVWSEYGKVAKLSMEEIDVAMREAKRQERLLIALEDAQAGVSPARSGLQRDKMTVRVKELTKQIKKAMRDTGLIMEKAGPDPEKQWLSALKTFKTRTQNSIKEYQRRLDEGDYVTTKRKPLTLDDTARTLVQQRDAVKARYQQKLEEMRPGKTWRTLSALRKSWMLSGLSTQLKNTLGTGAYQIFDEASRMPAVIMDAAISPITGQRSITGMSPVAALDSVLAAAKVGGKEFVETVKHGATAEQMAQHQFGQEVKLGKGWGEGNNFAAVGLNSGLKVVEVASKAIFRVMSGSDRIFYQGALRRNLVDRATVQAKNEARTDKGLNVRQRAKDLIANPSPELQASAVHDALVSTFNNSNTLSERVKRFRSPIRKEGETQLQMEKRAAIQNFVIDLIMPFDRTPTNVIARILEASPYGFGRNAKQLAQAVVRGSMSVEQQRDFSRTFGRATTGSSLMALGWYLAGRGILSGLAPSPNDRKKDKDEGIEPNSIKIGDQWWPIGSVSPTGNLLTIGAGLYREAHRDKPGVGKMIGTALQPLADQPMLKGANQLADVFRDPSRGTTGTAASFGFSFVPFSGALRDVSKATDSAPRRVPSKEASLTGLKEQFQQNIPGWRNKLPTEPEKKGGGEANPYTRAIERYIRSLRHPGAQRKKHHELLDF